MTDIHTFVRNFRGWKDEGRYRDLAIFFTKLNLTLKYILNLTTFIKWKDWNESAKPEKIIAKLTARINSFIHQK
jgi:hypothetical protein